MKISGPGWTGRIQVTPDVPKYVHFILTLWGREEKIVQDALDSCVNLFGLGRQRYVRCNPEVKYCDETGEWQGYTRFSYRADIGSEETVVSVPADPNLAVLAGFR